MRGTGTGGSSSDFSGAGGGGYGGGAGGYGGGGGGGGGSVNDAGSGTITLAGNGFNQNVKALVIAHGQFDTAKFEAKAEEVAKEKSQFLKIVKEGNHKLY